jgi:pyridoxine kinase
MKKSVVKKVAALHDLSGFGRSSLAVVIPILSTMGVQVCSLPTALLSTQTGGFEGYYFTDLTEQLEGIIQHWRKLGLKFDSIYSGFLGSPKQAYIVADFIDDFAEDNALIVVDPVMADDGKLYDTMNEEMVSNMRELIRKANVITPNFTEAAFLLNEKYHEKCSVKEIKEWLVRLAEMGPDIVIITSAPDCQVSKNTCVIAYDRRNNRFWKVSCVFIPAHFPGAGDVFSSVIVGSLLQGDSLPIALDRGVRFVTTGIRASYGYEYPRREGILLERVLGSLNLPVVTGTYEILE